MSSERALWVTARRHLTPYGKLVRIENAASLGTPDVCYCLLGRMGWLELKEDRAPRAGKPVRLESLKLEQVLFLEDWERAGGRAWLLAQLGRSYALLSPTEVRAVWRGELFVPERRWWQFPTRPLVKLLIAKP